MPETIIEIKDLWFSFNGGAPVLENVNLEVARGEFMAVIGPNGGGKTTLVKIMLGLYEPDRGTVRVFGKSPAKSASRLGYVPQNTGANRSVPVTVLHAVLMGRMKAGGGWRRFSKSDHQAARRALEQVGMWEYQRRLMTELSGGQRQRVLLARALVSDPEVLVLDEPTASVDSKSQGDFFHLLKELNEKATILIVSHDLMVLSTYVKSVACVARVVHFHNRPEITKDMLETAYHCPVELIAHGVPHRVLHAHEDD